MSNSEADRERVAAIMYEGYPLRIAAAIANDMARLGNVEKSHKARLPLGEGWEPITGGDHCGEVKCTGSWETVYWWPDAESANRAADAFSRAAVDDGDDMAGPGSIHLSVEAGRFAFRSSYGSDEWVALPNDKNGGMIGVYEGGAVYQWPDLKSATSAYAGWEAKWKRCVRDRVVAEAKGAKVKDHSHEKEWRYRRIAYAALDCAELHARHAQSNSYANPMDVAQPVTKSQRRVGIGSSTYRVVKHQDLPPERSVPNLPEPNREPPGDMVTIEDDTPTGPVRLGPGGAVVPANSGLLSRKR
jgi:hypothetical protein